MTKPIKHPEENVVYKGPTPDIGDLSCYRAKPGLILSEWDLTIAERLAIMRGATIELGIYMEPIPPVSLSIVKRPGGDGEALEYVDPHGPYRAVEPGDLEAEMVLAAVDALGLTPPERSVVSGPVRKARPRPHLPQTIQDDRMTKHNTLLDYVLGRYLCFWRWAAVFACSRLNARLWEGQCAYIVTQNGEPRRG